MDARPGRLTPRLDVGKPEGHTPHHIRTHYEIARIMTERGYPMGHSNVQYHEKRALKKLAAALGPEYEELLSGLV